MQPAARGEKERGSCERAEKTTRIGSGRAYVREREWLKDNWSASANVRKGERDWEEEQEWKWQRQWNFQIDVQLCLLLSWQRRRRHSFTHGLWLAHTRRYMRADMHVNIFACICVHKMNFLCRYFVTLCSCICVFFSSVFASVCKMPNCSALCELLRPCVHITRTLDSDSDLSPLSVCISLSLFLPPFGLWGMTFPRNLATMCYK